MESPTSSWIWMDTDRVEIAQPIPSRPYLRFGERILGRCFDKLEHFLGPKDPIFQLRNQIFSECEVLIRQKRTYMSSSVHVDLAIDYEKPEVTSDENEKVAKTHSTENIFSASPELLENWIRQQFAIWVIEKRLNVSPILNISITFDELSKPFIVRDIYFLPFSPSIKFEIIVPHVRESISLGPNDFSKDVCHFGRNYLKSKLEIDFDTILPLLDDNHIRIYWDVQPWIRNTGDHETWCLSGKKWEMLSDNAFVPLIEENIIILGRMTKNRTSRFQPVPGSLVLRYVGKKEP